MSTINRITTALISVYHKDNLHRIISRLDHLGVKIYSTGGTLSFIEDCGVQAESVESLTGYPSILGGRVKTLHPKVFGGILARRENEDDLFQLHQYHVPEIDLVIVDLYPFGETVASGASEKEIIEKIDIGGISLIRAAAKNYKDVAIISSRSQYPKLMEILEKGNGTTTLEERRQLAREAFDNTSHYDSAIFSYFCGNQPPASFKLSIPSHKPLRYGENPHQNGSFYGNFDSVFEQLHGKEISYNNLLDIDAAVNLCSEFQEPTIAILKHNNACGLATDSQLSQAWEKALAADPVSAFGGVIIANRPIDGATAKGIDKLFFEVLIAPEYSSEALTLLQTKKNRILLKQKLNEVPTAPQVRSVLNGVLVQDRDTAIVLPDRMKTVTQAAPSQEQLVDMVFANKIVKHSKSNAIVLAKNNQLIASGVGQTSRIDALKHAIDKAKVFGLSLSGAVMASDAFFPFPDSVEVAGAAGIKAIVQPGGSVRDQDSIDLCNELGIAMVLTGVRHFKH